MSDGIYKLTSNTDTTSNNIATSIGSGAGGLAGGGTGGLYYEPYSYQPLPINYYYTYPPQPVKYDIQLQKVENGWILHKDGKRYIITEVEQVAQYLK